MATYYTTENQLSAASRDTLDLSIGNRIIGTKQTGVLRYAEANILFDGTEAAADVFRLFKLEAGAIVIPQLSYIYVTVDAAATLTLDVGHLDSTTNADEFADGVDIGATGVDVFATGAATTVPYTLLTNCWITATLATCSTPIAAGAIKIIVAYR